MKLSVTVFVLFLFSHLSLWAAVEKTPYLLFEGRNDQMTVMWQLTNRSSCTIEWGKTTDYELGSKRTYEFGNDHQHKHRITNLTPNTVYYYNVKDVGAGSFRTAPETTASKTKLIAYGDTRNLPSKHDSVAAQIMKRIKSDSTFQTAVLFSGDYVDHGFEEEDWTNHFFPRDRQNIVKLHATMPNIGSIGNHEGNRGSELLRKYYPFPHVRGHFWTFEYGPAQVFVLDQYTQSYTMGSAQYNWLQVELANCDKEWKIVMYHSPGYSAGGSHPNNSDVQYYLQPLFEEYDVDIVINGDNHYYARSSINGVTHLTTGGGGAPLHTPNEGMPFVKRAERAYHFCEIDLDGHQATITARRASGSIIESFTLKHESHEYSINLTSPEYQQTYAAGVNVPIVWSGNPDQDHTIQLLQNNEVVHTICTETNNKGAYYWTIPKDISIGDYTIKISSNTNSSISDISQPFSIAPAIVLTNPIDVFSIANWTMEGDEFGSTFSIDSSNLESHDVTVKLSLVESNELEEIYPWAKLFAWVSAKNFEGVTAIGIEYSANKPFQVFLEDSTLSMDGIAYEYSLKQGTDQSVLISPDMFSQPYWISDDQKKPLDLLKVNALSFGSTKPRDVLDFNISSATIYNLRTVPAEVISTEFKKHVQPLQMQKDKMLLHVGKQPIQVTIITPNGRVALKVTIETQGSHAISLKELQLATGIYFYKIDEASHTVKTGNLFIK